MDRLKSKLHSAKEKFKEEVDELQEDLSRLKVAAQTTWNPNHRHDEEHEKQADRLRAEILNSHRFQSFAPEREGNNVKWYIDGHDYFWALSEILEEATETIWILDWWLSPETYLRRPPAQYEAYRLDRILKRKAEQGVKIFVIVYKDVVGSMSNNSKYTKHALEELHENISCMRHPDHSGGEIVMYWSHHEKVVIVDNAIACVGGLDICYGRWDTHNHAMADSFPDDIRKTVFPGQDYNDARVADFENVQAWAGNQQARLELGRLPWADCHMMACGPIVMDTAQHFVERWNFCRDLKYRHSDRYPLLDWPHDDPLNDQLLRHPWTGRIRQFGHRFRAQTVHLDSRPRGNMRVQMCRSVGDWSIGWLTEHSIQNAYIQLIREANHFILIENQFFISWPAQKGPVKNGIAAALVERILSAARAGEKFKVIVLLPEVPCFAGDLKAQGGILAIIDAQYKSMVRGPDSIWGMIAAAGFNPKEYINFYNLRQYDRIKYDPVIIQDMQRQSGIEWGNVLAAYARLNIGDHPPELEAKNNETIRFRAMKYGDAIHSAAQEGKSGKPGEDIKTIPLPASVREAEDIITRFEAVAPPQWKDVPASIARNTLQSGRAIFDEPWYGSEAAEKDAFVSEELYIHSKLMIVDDRKVLCGSANINERSQLGDRDSETAWVIEDQDLFETVMGGRKYMASRFAASMRRRLMRQHLGLIKPQDLEGPITDSMRSVGVPNEYDFGSQEDQVVEDPLSDQLQKLWDEVAVTNADIFQELFHCVPAKGVKNWKDYDAWVPAAKKIGHIANQDKLELSYIKQQLSRIRGSLVAMPTDFLEEAGLLELSAAVNPITISIYL